MVFLLLSHGAKVDTVDNDGDTSLLWCLKNRASNDMIRLLLEFGAEASFADADGNTAMHLFAQQGNNDMDMVTINALYMAGAKSCILVKNKAGSYPHEVNMI